MTAGHDDRRDARADRAAGTTGEPRGHTGVDALMAAVTGEPLPEEARRDAALVAEHRAAEADVALLKDQLVRLAEALTGEPRAPEAAPAPGGASASGDARVSEGAPAAGEVPTPGNAPAHEGAPVPGGSVRPRSRARDGGRPYGPPRPAAPAGRPRALRLALGSLAGVAACSLVVGLGWLVTRPAGGADDSAAGAKSAARAPDKVSGDGGRPSDPERELACSKLVVEGTVAGVQPRRPSPWSRITLTVIRSYKPVYGPAHAPAEVRFLLDGGAEPAPRKGQHVLVRVGRGEPGASLWAVGDARVAADRAWIEQALPGSRHVTCPSDRSS